MLLSRLVPAASREPLSLPTRIEIRAQSVHLLLPAGLVDDIDGHLADGEALEPDRQDPSQLRLILPIRVKPHGGRTWIVGVADAPRGPTRS